MTAVYGLACVFCTLAAVLPPFETLARINVVLAVSNGLFFIASMVKR